MPRGGGRGKVSHKGRRRHFSSVDELKAEEDKVRRQQEWRESQGIGSDDEEERGATATIEEEDESDDSEEEGSKKKGVASLIEIENPNHVAPKLKKVSELDSGPAVAQLSRKEREVIEKQQAKERYLYLKGKGLTDEGRADMARLAIIRKEREEAAKKREEAKKAKEAEVKAAAEKAAEARQNAVAPPAGGRRRGKR